MKNLIAKTLSLMLVLGFIATSAQAGTKVTGDRAVTLILALIRSGFDVEIEKDIRTRKISQAHIVTVTSLGHDCDEATDSLCGLGGVKRISDSTQKGKAVNVTDETALISALSVMNSTSDSGMGHHYQDFGTVSCQWKISNPEKYPVQVQYAVCISDVYSNPAQ